jgi:hypothetical protein
VYRNELIEERADPGWVGNQDSTAREARMIK